MVSTNALRRDTKHAPASTTRDSTTRDNTAQDNMRVDEDLARKVALSWMDITAAERTLMQMGASAVEWRTAPAAHNAMAAMIGDMIAQDMAVFCAGMQPYAYQSACGMSITEIMREYLGKTLPANVMHLSAEDICTMIAKGRTTVAALHVETQEGWNDVRAIAGAAVRMGAPMLILVCASHPAPEGIAIDMPRDWNAAVLNIREAMETVRNAGAIRIVVMDDMAAPVLERAMMDASAMTPSAWEEAMQKNNDGAEVAANAAYQSPVESF